MNSLSLFSRLRDCVFFMGEQALKSGQGKTVNA
jgi:hypothetical protein